nr:hypothetical protein [uncultured Mucilaginibacter sp.]
MTFTPRACKLMRRRLKYLVLMVGGLLSFNNVFAQSSFEDALQKQMDVLLAPVKGPREELLPNPVLQSITVPSGWGGFGSYVFGGVGGNNMEPYGTDPDLISFAGFCFGDPERAVNIAVSFNATDISNVSNFSGNLSVSRRVFVGSSISAGAMQLFANPRLSDSQGSTIYIAFSHAIQSLPSSLNPGSSKLSYTIGIGTGRFYRKSPYDIQAGRGYHGTAIFGSISYELLKKVNFNAEWSGMNLGCSLGIKPFEKPLALGIGLTNLTRFSSDKVNASFVVCYPLSIKR